MINPYIVLLVLSCTVFSSARSGEPPKTFQAEDVFELEYANDPRISPDGKYIVYERRSSDIIKLIGVQSLLQKELPFP